MSRTEQSLAESLSREAAKDVDRVSARDGWNDNSEQLFAGLRQAIAGEVRFDAGSRGAYSTDASNYRQIPLGVVVPRNENDVVQTVALCRMFGVPLTSRGGGTSLAGQACNSGIILDFSKYLNRVLEIDTEKRTAIVEPGCVLDDLRGAAKEYGLTFGPDPATHNRNTLGGMIGNNSCGIHSVMSQFYGPGPLTADNVESLDVLTYGGVRLQVGRTSDEDLQSYCERDDEIGFIYRQLVELRDRYADEIRRRYPDIPRRVSGYNLDRLLPDQGFNLAAALVGTEGTCVTVLKAEVKLIDARPARTLVVLGYDDVYAAGDAVPQIMEYRPVGLEGIDAHLIEFMKRKGLHPKDVQLMPDGEGWLLVEFGGDTKDQSNKQAERFVRELKAAGNSPHIKLFEKEWAENKLWEVRESGLGATAHVPNMPTAHPGWEDAAVPPEHVGEYLRDFRQLLEDFDYQAALYGHFGQGCIHCRITFDLKTEEGISKYSKFIELAAELVTRYGGSLSGEHGDGQARASLLETMYGPEILAAMRQFKTIWDPTNRMNPGKVVDPYLPTENLKYSPENYHPAVTPRTYFALVHDDGSFVAAANRCVGVGKCRRSEGGTMCPSYMVTREEEHSTRGRARLLFEMLQGDVVRDGWQDEHVKESLDLCLACKGCRSECPVNVDMATYKAEFLAHYYKGKLRPIHAYAMGWIYWWARLASKVPRVANFFARTPPFSTLAKRIAGVARERQLPTFATQTLRDWFLQQQQNRRVVSGQTSAAGVTPSTVAASREEKGKLTHADVPRFLTDTYTEEPQEQGLNPHSQRSRSNVTEVLLWPDTFTNYLMPGAGKAAARVLEHAGFDVRLPEQTLCCGRPLYDYGMLSTAKKMWLQILRSLEVAIEEGVPLVGVEPSCVAAFRDELVNMVPGDSRAQKLSDQTYLLSEFLIQEDYQPPKLHRSAIVHGHCHHKSVMHMDAEVDLLQRIGLDYELLDSGCCGMAGAFGFEAEHYDVSVAVGERVLLPAVRRAGEDTLIIANGFSCRQQILQCTGRQAMHVAEVIALALDQ